jgi:hypothetical protein
MFRPVAVIGTLALALIATATTLCAGPGVVITQQGYTYRGDVTEGDGTVTVNIHGVEMILKRENVASIQYDPGDGDADAQGDAAAEQEYRRRHDVLTPADLQGRLNLARWAFDRGAYALAREAAEEARVLDLNNIEAATMLETIQSQIRLERGRAEAATPDAQPGRSSARKRLPLLDAQQINVIRQEELSEEDAESVRFAFDDEVRRRFAEQTSATPQQFLSLPASVQAMRIIRSPNADADMRRDVRVMSDPPALAEFRRVVQPVILHGCATAQCHGSAAAGGFALVSPASDDAETYTNFHLLQRYRKPQSNTDGVFGRGELVMIDRLRPAESLILQYGLPSNLATSDHPPVRNWRPVFNSRDDRGYQRVLDWLSSSIRTDGKGDYGFDDAPAPGIDDLPPPPQPQTQPSPQ